jgi:hypothetical protein
MLKKIKNMKKKFVFTLLFVNLFLTAQTYHFDVMIKYGYKQNSIYNEVITYGNTNDDNISLTIFKNNDLWADLRDLKNKMLYHFSVVENNTNQGIMFDFTYKNSHKIDISGYSKKMDYDFAELKKDSIFNIIVYKNKKKVKVKANMIFKIQKHESKLFHLFRSDFYHKYSAFDCNFIDFPFIVISTQFTEDKKLLETSKLVHYKNVDFDITIPK